MKHLHKWGIKNTPNCTNCQVEETLMHAIFDCPVAQTTMKNTSDAYYSLTGERITITREISLVGFNRNTPNCHSLNTILTLVKQRLILQRENKQIITNDMIMDIILRQLQIERYIAKKQNRLNTIVKRWHNSLYFYS